VAPQPKPTIISQGQGFARVERQAWDPIIVGMFQTKTWADQQFMNSWANQHLRPFIQQHILEGQECIYFCDNLDAQVSHSFLWCLRSMKCFRWLLPTNFIFETQPMDAGLGRLLKIFISREFEEWLEIVENLDI